MTSAFASEESVETITFKDDLGNEHEEYAFRAPVSGVPPQVLDMYCANIKLRLYWGTYRETILDSSHKGIYLRRMSRFAKHVFDEIKDADKPFNATMLSVVDEYFAVKEDGTIEGEVDVGEVELDSRDADSTGAAEEQATTKKHSKGIFARLKIKNSGIEKMFKRGTRADGASGEIETIESSESFKELEQNSSSESVKKLKNFVKKWIPKVGLGLYTRWRTMWWMMMSCLFAKYYLWDPALDEFIKLKRNLAMYPDFQLMRLQDLDCKPVTFFRRIIDVCKILNPLFYIDFGTLSLDKLTRFKSDTHS